MKARAKNFSTTVRVARAAERDACIKAIESKMILKPGESCRWRIADRNYDRGLKAAIEAIRARR